MSVPLRHLPIVLITSVCLHNITWAQETIEEKEERFRQRSEKIESEELATPFGGITTNGKIVPGLFNRNQPECLPSRLEQRLLNSLIH